MAKSPSCATVGVAASAQTVGKARHLMRGVNFSFAGPAADIFANRGAHYKKFVYTRARFIGEVVERLRFLVPQERFFPNVISRGASLSFLRNLRAECVECPRRRD